MKYTTGTIPKSAGKRSSPSLHQIPKVIESLGYDVYTIKEDLGEKIIRGRLALGTTQKELARRLGIDPSILGQWERGERRPAKDLSKK